MAAYSAFADSSKNVNYEFSYDTTAKKWISNKSDQFTLVNTELCKDLLNTNKSKLKQSIAKNKAAINECIETNKKIDSYNKTHEGKRFAQWDKEYRDQFVEGFFTANESAKNAWLNEHPEVISSSVEFWRKKMNKDGQKTDFFIECLDGAGDFYMNNISDKTEPGCKEGYTHSGIFLDKKLLCYACLDNNKQPMRTAGTIYGATCSASSYNYKREWIIYKCDNFNNVTPTVNLDGIAVKCSDYTTESIQSEGFVMSQLGNRLNRYECLKKISKNDEVPEAASKKQKPKSAK